LYTSLFFSIRCTFSFPHLSFDSPNNVRREIQLRISSFCSLLYRFTITPLRLKFLTQYYVLDNLQSLFSH
jgi:hypothetical protein